MYHPVGLGLEENGKGENSSREYWDFYVITFYTGNSSNYQGLTGFLLEFVLDENTNGDQYLNSESHWGRDS